MLIMFSRVVAVAAVLTQPFSYVHAFTLSVATMSVNVQKAKLWDMPVSNNGARCRFVIYEKGIEDEIEIVSPMEAGGLKSEQFLKINPHGKVPTMSTSDCGSIPESDTICLYLLDKFEGKGSSFRPSTLESRMKAAAICRLFDTYIHPIQGSLYKLVPPFGVHSDRLAAIKDLETQLAILEELASGEGPFLAGSEVSLADATAWPTVLFFRFMMPKFDKQDFMGPRLTAWCGHMESHPAGKRIAEEINGALEQWSDKGRWDGILHAGKRDTAPASIFDKIIAKEIPSTVVFEDDRVLAFRYFAPVAPTHILIIPKRRNGLTQLRHAMADHAGTLGYMLEVAAMIATQEGLEGFRVVINDGAKGGQEVFHLHMHLIDLHTESRRRHSRGERESLHSPQLDREREAARQRAAAARRRETDEARAERLRANRQRAAARRRQQTPEQRAANRQKQAKRRQQETPQASEARRAANRLRAAAARQAARDAERARRESEAAVKEELPGARQEEEGARAWKRWERCHDAT